MAPATDPYLIPGTDCLDNRLGITDPGQLAQAEADITLVRIYELMTWRALPGDFDLAHLRDFHQVIFGDVYPWAGQVRLVDMAKPAPQPGAMPTMFTLVQDLPAASDDLFARLAADSHLRDIPNRDRFVSQLAGYYCELNQAHPFREGNGRAQRAFWQQLAAEAGWSIDWLKVSPAAVGAAGAAPTHRERTVLATRMLAPAISPDLDHPLHRTRARVNAALLRSLTGRSATPCNGPQPGRPGRPAPQQRRQERGGEQGRGLAR